MKILLTNQSGRCLVFVLPHESYCAKAARCGCQVEAGREGRRTAGSLTLAVGLTSPGVDRAVLLVPQVDRAIRRGELQVSLAPPRDAVAHAAAPAATSPVAPRSPKKRGT